MELSVQYQIFEQIKKSQKILIALPENLSADALASGLAFWLFLNKLKKDVSLVSKGQIPETLKFLPVISVLQNQIKGGKSLVVSLTTAEKKLDEISYQADEKEKKVRIYLKAQSTEFTPEDISFSVEKFPLDLIIVLGAQSLADLGTLYDQSADLFFETPKINIDHLATNEYFGQSNLVDITATSVAEILADLLGHYEAQLFDEDIATCLLAGIIEKTSSFQHVRTTPKAFLKASELINFGARQQEIIKHIYKTKALPLLKLWGRALARIKILELAKTVYSVLTLNDFNKAESGEAEILPALKELIDNISGYNIIGLICEPSSGRTIITVAVHQQIALNNFLASLGENGKILEASFGNYRLGQIEFSNTALDVLEQNFAQTSAKYGVS